MVPAGEADITAVVALKPLTQPAPASCLSKSRQSSRLPREPRGNPVSAFVRGLEGVGLGFSSRRGRPCGCLAGRTLRLPGRGKPTSSVCTPRLHLQRWSQLAGWEGVTEFLTSDWAALNPNEMNPGRLGWCRRIDGVKPGKLLVREGLPFSAIVTLRVV